MSVCFCFFNAQNETGGEFFYFSSQHGLNNYSNRKMYCDNMCKLCFFDWVKWKSCVSGVQCHVVSWLSRINRVWQCQMRVTEQRTLAARGFVLFIQAVDRNIHSLLQISTNRKKTCHSRNKEKLPEQISLKPICASNSFWVENECWFKMARTRKKTWNIN